MHIPLFLVFQLHKQSNLVTLWVVTILLSHFWLLPGQVMKCDYNKMFLHCWNMVKKTFPGKDVYWKYSDGYLYLYEFLVTYSTAWRIKVNSWNIRIRSCILSNLLLAQFISIAILSHTWLWTTLFVKENLLITLVEGHFCDVVYGSSR